MPLYRILLASSAALAVAWFAACSSDDAPVATAPATLTATAGASESATRSTTAQYAGEAPDAARAFLDLEVLAGDIGSRPAGSPEERAAAEYIADQFEAAGYTAELDSFSFERVGDQSAVDRPGLPSLPALGLDGAPSGSVSAPAIFAGLGSADDLRNAGVNGRIVVLDRGELTFGEKGMNAQAAGAVGVIVINNQPGLVQGTIDGEAITIPMVTVAGEHRSGLLASAQTSSQNGEAMTIRAIRATDTVQSQNVIGRPSGAACTHYLGAHYDSVPAGPGANDNASGTAAMIELARVLHRDGLCMIAFGAEELGLYGSRHVIETADLSTIEWLINIDMVGKVTAPRFIGDAGLSSQAATVATRLGRTIPPGSFPARASSDHAPFLEADIPAITAHSGDDEFIHTAEDAISNVAEADLAMFLEVIAALVEELAPRAGG